MEAKWGVNWKNGMKISRDQFIKERSFTAFRSSLTNSLNVDDHRFGVFSLPGQKNLNYLFYNNQLAVENCIAISRFGWLIYVNEENSKKIQTIDLLKLRSEFENGDKVQVYMSICPDEDVEFGHADGASFPIISPNASFKYELKYMAMKNAMAMDSMKLNVPIMSLVIKDDGVEVNEEYVPPVFNVSANPKLTEWHKSLADFNFDLARWNNAISQTMARDAHSNFVKANLVDFSRRISFFLADQMDVFNSNFKFSSPVEIYLFYKRLNRLINASIVNMTNNQESLNQIGQLTNLPTPDLMAGFEMMNSLDYNHLNLHSVVKTINQYKTFMTNVFSKLSKANF